MPGGTIPGHDGSGPLHVAFAIGRDELSEWERRLTARQIEIEGRTDWPRGGRSIYFRDPDGHPLELIHFPADKGKQVWRESERELFLGVDHSAIVVADTEASVAFYRDELGLAVVGEAHNHGAEQEALTGLPGASMRVTSLAGSGTLRLELLEYLAPGAGRPMPADTNANDMWWAETLIEFDKSEGEPRSMHRSFRDPDGHSGEII